MNTYTSNYYKEYREHKMKVTPIDTLPRIDALGNRGLPHIYHEQHYFDNLEICLRKEFDEKIANNNSSNLQEQIDDLKGENNRLHQELILLKQSLVDTLAALATK